jgi:hypothetical protein
MNNDMGTFIELVRSPIERTWDAIASDVLELEGKMDNETAVECAIDANRVAAYGGHDGPAADALIREQCATHGYGVVLAALAAAIQLH